MKRNLLKIAALLSLGVVSPAFAATDGSVGPSSTGTSDLELIVPKMIQITGMGNLSATYSPGSDVTMDHDICIYTNLSSSESGTYKVVATGNYAADGTAGDAFYLKRTGTATTIPYTVKYNDEAGTTNNVAMTAGATHALTGQTGYSNVVNTACTSGQNANYQIIIDEDDILAKFHGTYTGTLTLVVTPE